MAFDQARKVEVGDGRGGVGTRSTTRAFVCWCSPARRARAARSGGWGRLPTYPGPPGVGVL